MQEYQAFLFWKRADAYTCRCYICYTWESGRSPQSAKLSKPYPAFLLFTHAGEQWAKKIRGCLYYFFLLQFPQHRPYFYWCEPGRATGLVVQEPERMLRRIIAGKTYDIEFLNI